MHPFVHGPASLCDPDTMQPAYGAFIEADIRTCWSGMWCALRIEENFPGYVSALMKHRTRRLAYGFSCDAHAIAAMQLHLDADHKKLPLVFPLLFYPVMVGIQR